jgi:hypothetical protein
VWAPDGALPDLEVAAAKARLPLLVVSPEPTRTLLDPKRTVFWAGGVRPVEEALQAMDFALLPLGSHRPALLHDGSARGADAALRCGRLHHVTQTPGEPQVVGPAFDADTVRALAEGGADALVFFGGPAAAERVLRAVVEARSELPVLLGQGLASAAVPSFHKGLAKNAWALEAQWFEDHGGLSRADRAVLDDALRAAERDQLLPATVRGYRVGRWLQEAVRLTGSQDARKLVESLRALGRERARGRPVFEPWGHASLGRFEYWRAAPTRDSPACHRVRDTLVPIAGIPQVGFFPSARYGWEPGSHYVQVTFGEGAARTIEQDLEALGLHSGVRRQGAASGGQGELEERLLDDLLGRSIARLNRLFLRDPDGTAVPGLSFNVSFGAGPPPKDVRSSRRWYVVVAGDDPVAGGRASGDKALVFPTFLVRTIYMQHRLAVPLGPTDLPYFKGQYRWHTSLEENLRGDTVRSLLDGFTQGIGLTGAHELGHLAGCQHDTETPRSIMNVVDAVGLDFEWAEWIPSHLKALETRLGRVPAAD